MHWFSKCTESSYIKVLGELAKGSIKTSKNKSIYLFRNKKNPKAVKLSSQPLKMFHLSTNMFKVWEIEKLFWVTVL